MSGTSRKSKLAALLGVLTIASSGAFAPPPAQARPSCEDSQRQVCNTWMPDQGIRVWQFLGFSSLEECTADHIANTCPWQFSKRPEGLREERSL